MCSFLIKDHPTLQSIDHNFFETGHTEMECDSIHSKIEKKSKNIPVYSPEGWAQIIRTARNNPFPFVVKTMQFDDFYDFKSLAKETDSRKIPWRNVCWLQYRKSDPFKIFYKNSFKEKQFIEINLNKRRGRPKKLFLPKAYSEKLSISEPKLKDLKKMCTDYTIPREYHSFYDSLESSKLIRDKLPEPDVEEHDSENE